MQGAGRGGVTLYSPVGREEEEEGGSSGRLRLGGVMALAPLGGSAGGGKRSSLPRG